MAGNPVKIGILALQGAVQPHEEKLRALDVEPVQIRYPRELASIKGIILPGGESTTMIHLLKLHELWEPLREFSTQMPTWGICAGAILISRGVTHPSQDSLGLLDAQIERNAYGRQNESFIDVLEPTENWRGPKEVEGVFIRAPKFKTLGPLVKPLLRWQNEIVMVEDENLLASTFHPELSRSSDIHEYFVQKCEGGGHG